MRHIGDLLKDLGFNKDAPLETQKAFIRHLVKVAESTKPPTPLPVPLPVSEVSLKPPEQLSFDSDILELRSQSEFQRKSRHGKK